MTRRQSTSAILSASFCTALAAMAPVLRAQMHKVEAPEKVTRAIGVYEWTGDLSKPNASRLIPVSLFINGHFEDAGAYLARPVPWVLDTGNEYFIERAGRHEGTLEVEYARNLVTMGAVADDNPLGAWYGYGKFLQPSAEPKPKTLPAARVNPTIEGSDDDSRPHMSRRTPPSVSSGGSGSGSSGSSGSNPPDDADRPTLGRRAPASTGSSTDSTSTTSSNDDYDPDRPTLRHRDDNDKKNKKSKPQGYVTGPEDSLNDDPDRPRLRHGEPPGEKHSGDLTGLPAQMHQAVAVSDPVNHPAHLFTREWDSATDRATTLRDIETLARPRVAAYLAENKLTPGLPPPVGASTSPAAAGSASSSTFPDDGAPPVLRTKASADAAKAAAAKAAPTPKPATTPASKHTASRSRTPARPAPLTLTDEQVSGYELSYGGLPTFLYTAQVPVTNGGPVYITLVAQRLPSGEMQIALASVTDAQHLNRTPWMRPVDVVDPDEEHRASLLFELRAQNSRQFALYRLTGPQAEQIFVTGVIE